MVQKLQQINLRWGNVTRLYTLSKTTWGGRELWVLQISTDANRERSELKPMFKYVANMHGNEAVGKELLLGLPEFLLERYYSGHNSEIEMLVNSTDIHFLFTMNPDGFEQATLGNCRGADEHSGRLNGRNVDLNRNFPTKNDLEKPLSEIFRGKEPETRSVMRWILENPFVLSANFHDGAVVANYPFDDSALPSGIPSLTPDNELFKHLATLYASNHEDMFLGTGLCKNDHFPNGITNGAEWYVVKGGMQDFNYLFSNCFEITVELSCCKYPEASNLEIHWRKNIKSLIKFIQGVHIGVKGIVLKPNGKPVMNAKILIDGNSKIVRTTERGEYWRLLLPGIYYIHAEGEDGKLLSDIKRVNVTSNNVMRLDFILSANLDGDAEPTNYDHFENIIKLFSFISGIIISLFNNT